jgi:hypothetical protein|tara:strand:- start:260 stop:916 length:657 start_codon:yes stop_codon:yes gene_type:complete
MTTIEAINQICLACGLRAPGATATGTSSPAGMAESYLDLANEEIQSTGWPENTDDMVEVTRSGSNTYTTTEYGTDVLLIRTTGPDAWMQVRELNGALQWFDQSQSGNPWTGTFNTNLKFFIIRLVTFANLPSYLARYIAADATRQFFSAEVFQQQIDGQHKFEMRRRIESEYLKHKNTAEQHSWQQLGPAKNLLNTRGARMIRGRNRGFGPSLLLGDY